VSETKWTPGPWQIVRLEEESAFDPYMEVARGLGPNDDWTVEALWREPVPDEQLEANARLISAAPELYEALEELLEAVAVIGQAMPPLMYPPACGDRCIKALAALSKAQNADAAKSDARWGALLDVVRERRAKWDADRVKNRAWLDRAFGEAS
jgi:hypothetical protein